MKVLFLTIGDNIREISTRGIYKDLMRKFRDENHDVYIATPIERRNNKKTSIIRTDSVSILMIKTPNITQTNLIEKGLATILIEYLFLRALKKYLSDINFDLVLYSTPPITFAKVINYLKNKDNSLCYLLLKDIFPQNAVDIGIIKEHSLLYNYFRKKEKELYKVSDCIGCMSPANVDFVIRNNPEIKYTKIEVNPNSIEPIIHTINNNQKSEIRNKYKIPSDATVFIYGGSIGRPQGIMFLIDVLNHELANNETFFIIVGSGTEFGNLKAWFDKEKPRNALLLSVLTKDEFDLLMRICDVGMIFLDRRFTIPNFPSRMLSYMEFKLPILASTDKNTDLGKIIEDNNFGLWSESGNLHGTIVNIQRLAKQLTLRHRLGQNGYKYLLENYTVTKSYKIIMNHFNKSLIIQ